jgi:hypothetical protein
MKRNYTLLILTSLILIQACGNLLVKKKDPLPEPDKIVFECNGVRYSSDATHIRAMGTGTSRNESTASRMASLDASVNLAKAIEAYLEKISAYKDKRQVKQGAPAVEWEDGSLTREEINMTLSNVATICSQTSSSDEMYTTRMIVEIPLSEIMQEGK